MLLETGGASTLVDADCEDNGKLDTPWLEDATGDEIVDARLNAVPVLVEICAEDDGETME